jgi:hypothetical protein
MVTVHPRWLRGNYKGNVFWHKNQGEACRITVKVPQRNMWHTMPIKDGAVVEEWDPDAMSKSQRESKRHDLWSQTKKMIAEVDDIDELQEWHDSMRKITRDRKLAQTEIEGEIAPFEPPLVNKRRGRPKKQSKKGAFTKSMAAAVKKHGKKEPNLNDDDQENHAAILNTPTPAIQPGKQLQKRAKVMHHVKAEEKENESKTQVKMDNQPKDQPKAICRLPRALFGRD